MLLKIVKSLQDTFEFKETEDPRVFYFKTKVPSDDVVDIVRKLDSRLNPQRVEVECLSSTYDSYSHVVKVRLYKLTA